MTIPSKAQACEDTAVVPVPAPQHPAPRTGTPDLMCAHTEQVCARSPHLHSTLRDALAQCLCEHAQTHTHTPQPAHTCIQIKLVPFFKCWGTKVFTVTPW